ncbi:hypothetical protein [Streptomyces sp. NBC_00198]|uniref:hypothetical protein n=1 Tax=Streptomyces sp. NBC_00198 TaxID=2975677 RepID=UPI00225A374A|nr:hypothetical protein [Streptomyces sp. NBC_00198]MCX5285932.1 hypothetical protein [Streptomyces sp. NBC_00198]MCX5286241.1 hypothetical protein [Streptomyces sp. NBC_00198]
MSQTREPLPTLGEICTDVAAGSMVLARRVPVLIGRAWRLLVTVSEGAPEKSAAGKQGGKSGARAKKQAKGKGAADAKPDEKPDPAEKPVGKGAEQAEASGTTVKAAGEKDGAENGPKRATAKERSGSDLLEQLGLGAFTVVIGYVFLRPYLAVLAHALAPAAPPLFGTAVVLWIVAAYRAAPLNDHDEKSEGDQGEEHQNVSPDPAEVREAEQRLWLLVISRVQDAVADGRRGVHLSTLIEEPGNFPPGWDVTRLREHCKRVGIPVKSMQIRGSGRKGPTHGVHVDELTAALGMPLAEAFYLLNVGSFDVGDHADDSSSAELPETEHGAPETPPAAPSETPADTLQQASESTAPPPPVEAAPHPSPGERRPGLRARLHHPRQGAHAPSARTPSDAAARPSPEPHPQPLLEGDRSPGESPSTTPI